jgi:hypothetical protein
MRRLAVLVGVAATLAAAASAHAAGWTEPQEIVGAGGANAPAVDMNSRGDAAVVWATADSVFVAESRRGKAFGAPVQLASGIRSANRAQVDVDDAGNVAIGWIYDDGSFDCTPCDSISENCCDRLAGVVKPAGAAMFGRPRTLSRKKAQTAYFDVAAGKGGGGFIWATPDTFVPNELSAAFSRPDGELRSTSTIARLSGYINQVSLLIRRDGTASLAFEDDRVRLRERTRSAGGRLSAARTIAAGGDLDFVTRAADARGNEVGVWEHDVRTGWAVRRRGGRYGRPRTVPGAASTAFALAPDGGALLAWGDAKPQSVLAAARSPQRSFGKGRRLATSPDKQQWQSLAVAIGNGRRGMAAWQWSGDEATTGQVVARPWAGAGPSGPVRELALPGGGGPQTNQFPSRESPAVAADAQGNAIVVWDQDGRIGFARFLP